VTDAIAWIRKYIVPAAGSFPLYVHLSGGSDDETAARASFRKNAITTTMRSQRCCATQRPAASLCIVLADQDLCQRGQALFDHTGVQSETTVKMEL